MVRFPQVIKLFLNKSSEGLVPGMYYMDNYMMIIVGCYNIHLKNPFSVYGENFFILVQNIAIVLLIWAYNKEINITTKILVSLSVGGLFFILYTDTLVSESMWIFMINVQFVMLTIARTPQIWKNFKTSSTGQLAIITYGLNSIGGLARIGTQLKETSDFLNILSSILALVFNTIITFQIICYWNSPKKVRNENEDGPEEPTIVKKSSDTKPEKRTKTRID